MSCILHHHLPTHSHTNSNPRPRLSDAQTSPDPIDIPLDVAWKREVYEFTRDNLQHNAWGLDHAERDYLLAKELAAKSGLKVDDDVLFGSAFLHDVGICHQILEPAGFPMEKIDAVREAIGTHSYYETDEPKSNEAKVLHDADSLDFLGAIGVARILSITGHEPFTPDIASSVKLLESLSEAASKNITSGPYAEVMAAKRLLEMKTFLALLKQESFQNEHL